MAKICIICTLVATIPSLLSLSWKPTKIKFLYSLFNVSLSFFLFSFQVHEKTILITALSAILLFPFDPFMVFWFLQTSTFSMLPLLHKDQLTLPFIGLSGAYLMFTQISASGFLPKFDKSFVKGLMFLGEGQDSWLEKLLVPCFWISMIGQIVLTILFLHVKPPQHLPFLFPLFISAFSCCHFVFFYLYFNVAQMTSKVVKVKSN